jgi:UDP-N-acetylglucosamine diphosphorylase/glucosamine-1-phosphate N-acetyltransferase
MIETAEWRKFLPVTRAKFIWDITCGTSNPRARCGKLFRKVYFHSARLGREPFSSIKEDYPFPEDYSRFEAVINSQYIGDYSRKPETLSVTRDGGFISLFSGKITPDIIEALENNDLKNIMPRYNVIEQHGYGIFLKSLPDVIKFNAEAIIIDADLFYKLHSNKFVSKSAEIQQFVSIQAGEGPVIIDSGTVIRPFTIIDGPAYIGKNTLVDSARIRSGTTIGSVCRIGGEIESSVIESYTNKHHEGFLGHSYAGEWVNIGAMATTSDLKNNYGEVKINNGLETVLTGSSKFGSVICDYSKIGIGMMLGTGTVISEGCSLFQENKAMPSFVAPFSWGVSGNIYDIDRFISDTRKIMMRRSVEMSSGREKFLRRLYETRPAAGC